MPTARAGEIDRLVTDLVGADPVRREAAFARLRVLGPRAVPRLAHAAEHGDAALREAALEALDGSQDARARAAALNALHAAEPAVQVAAAGVLRHLLSGETDASVLDALTTIALDATAAPGARGAAIEALTQLPPEIVGPVIDRATQELGTAPPVDAPAAAMLWIRRHADAPLSQFHDLVKRAREQAEQATSDAQRRAWQTVRGTAHLALASRDRRVALYDLRDAFEAAAAHPLPEDFIEAIEAIGDASCIESLAQAWAKAVDRPAWRDRLVGAADVILQRASAGDRSAAVRKVRARFPGFPGT